MKVEDIKGKYFPVLDYGFVALVDVMGDDAAVEQAARVSYGKGTRKKSQTRGLLRYLLRMRHTSPFEQVELKFHMAMPMFVARQFIRHRTVSVNEYSGRYSKMPMLFYTPEREQFKKQSTDNKQGRDGEVNDLVYNSSVMRWEDGRKDVEHNYNEMLNDGVAKELARIDLPLSTYTQWYWKVDLHNLMHFLNLRCDSHAQWEIREYANRMAGMVKVVAPLTYEAWIDYAFCSETFSRQELMRLRGEEVELSPREEREFEEKMSKDLSPPDFSLDLSTVKDAAYFGEMWS